MDQPVEPLHIDVFHDTVWPWCRIGQRHLELALERWAGGPVTVRYRSFLLNPSIPPEGVEFQALMRAKGGGATPLEAFFAAPRQRGAEVGLTFNFEKIARAPNSLLSHRLIALAPEETQENLIAAIYAAFFEHGQDIGDLEVLLQIAAGQGLDLDALRRQLQNAAGLETVEADIHWAAEHGIRGVPFYVLAGRFGVSGAQPVEVMVRVLEEVQASRGEEGNR